MLYAELFTKLVEIWVVKLLPIVSYDGMAYAKPAKVVNPHEVCNFGLGYGG